MSDEIRDLLARLQIAARQAEQGNEDARKRARQYIDLLVVQLGLEVQE